MPVPLEVARKAIPYLQRYDVDRLVVASGPFPLLLLSLFYMFTNAANTPSHAVRLPCAANNHSFLRANLRVIFRRVSFQVDSI